MTGGRLRLGLRALRRVVVRFWVCDSMIVGAAPHTVSATRMAIRILRENIFSQWVFRKSTFAETRAGRHRMARRVPDAGPGFSFERECCSLGIYPAVAYFPQKTLASNRTRGDRWLS